MSAETETLEEKLENLEELKRNASVDERQFLTFQIGTEEFGVNILNIKEIITYTSMTRIPLVPEYIMGVMNVRGNVVPVLNLSPRFNMLTNENTRLTCIIIIELEEDDEIHEVGVRVDAVEDVISIRDNAIESAPDFGAKIRADFISGIGKVGERFVLLLNIESVLNLEELSRFDQYRRSVYLERAMKKKEAEKMKEQAKEHANEENTREEEQS